MDLTTIWTFKLNIAELLIKYNIKNTLNQHQVFSEYSKTSFVDGYWM